MEMPNENDPITQEQVGQAINLSSFPGAEPGSKGWHLGLFEPWALQFGYPEGRPLYAEVVVGAERIHIYFLNDGSKKPIILRRGEKPADYGVLPQNQ